jgi:peptide/nickel transport system permease protein
MGILAAVRENTTLDRAVQMVALVGQAMPSFWLGLMLMIVIGPAAWAGCRSRAPARGSIIVMPGIVLAFSAVPALTRLTRAGMIQAMGSDYIRTARAKGLSRASILLKHALRNAAIPGGGDRGRAARLHAGRLDRDRAGVRAARRGLPRLGKSIGKNDFPVVQAVVLVLAVIYVALTMVWRTC